MVPDETENKSVILDTTDQNKTTSDVLPDENKVLSDETENNNTVDNEVLPDDTISVNKMLLDERDNNDTVNIGEQRLTASSTTSTDGYPDTAATASSLSEATDITSNDLSADTPSNNAIGTKLENNTTNTTINEKLEGMSHGTTTAVLPDETARPLILLPEANLHTTLQMLENTTSTTHESNESDQADLDTKKPIRRVDAKWQEEPITELAENTETDTTRETVIGEITYTKTDTTLSNINENTDSKDNLALGDIPQGVSGMQPFETSSVISEPIEGDTAANTTPSTSISTSSSSFNKPTLVMNKKEINLAKRNRLKHCIIKLTELSNSDREKWLSGENSSSKTSRTTDSMESSDSSVSRYNMRSRPSPRHKCPARRTQPKINYTEHGAKDSSRDSNFEPVLKPLTPLNNKSHPTPSRIAMQKEIKLNKAAKRNHMTAFQDESQLPNNSNKATGLVNKAAKPNVPNAPPSNSPVRDATNSLLKNEVPEATQNMLPYTTDNNKNKNLPDTTDKNTTKPGKLTKGVFKTKQISIRRSKDPRTFKCSKCDTRTSSLKQLNAHFIETHQQVNCDICGKGFNTPGSLRNITILT